MEPEVRKKENDKEEYDQFKFDKGNNGDQENITSTRTHASKQKESPYCGLVMHEKSLGLHCKPFMTINL